MDINDIIGILVEQNSSFIEQNKNYKDMLIFAVGSIITLLVIFLTANFLTMRKTRKDEIDKIKSEIFQNIKTEALPELKQELNTNLDSRIQGKFSSLKSNISSLEYELKASKKSNLELEGELNLLKGDFYFEKEVYSNAFTYYIEAGNRFLMADSKGHTNGLLRWLEKTAINLPYVLSEYGKFNEYGLKLDPEFQPQVNKIANILKEKDLMD